jgi:16S rRNA (adenine1518-N6/adenine1519-N6)-dimethyltransferase
MKCLIDNNNFNFKKKYGQNFLIDENVLTKIVSYADIKDDTLVIEIGIGSGNLTKKIAQVATKVMGYEIDTNLTPIIQETLKPFSNVEIIYDDFLKRDLKKDLNDYHCQNTYVIANLPYYITTPIITKLIDEGINIDKMVIMVQKEVGNRLNAKPDTKEYNSLTIFINYYFDVNKLFDVSRNVFMPRPNVDSAVIELVRKKSLLAVNDEKFFFKLVRDAFQHKRKNLKNNLQGYDLNKIADALAKYDLDLTVRAEHLTIEQFADIANHL